MLNPYSHPIGDLAVVFAHSGLIEDEGNRIYSVAAARVRPGQRIREFKSHIRYRQFTERERYYSNLSKCRLESAPPIEAVKNEIRSFLGEAKVALVFDSNDNLAHLKALCGVKRIVDLSFAAEFFLQHLESHSFKRLWEYLFNKSHDRISFSASEIVRLSIELVKHICGVELNDRKNPRARAVRHYLKASDTLFGEILVHLNRNFRDYFDELFNPCTATDTDNWKIFLEKAPPPSTVKSEIKPRRRICREDIQHRFRGMADAGKGFQFRPSQAEYAGHIAQALDDNGILCIEAGTGTGKTQGYLVPVLEFLRRNPDARVAISTYTKNLQAQIFQREIRFTKEIFPIYADLTATLLKGKSSYICAEKLDYAYDPELLGSRLLSWLFLLNNVFNHEKADSDAVGENVISYLDDQHFFAHLLSTVSAKDGCTANHRRCPAQVVTARARNSRLIVTNHHKLVHLAQDPVLAGLFRNHVIDEANHFADAVRGAFKIEANSSEISRSLSYLEKTSHKILRRAAGAEKEALENSLENMTQLRNSMKELRDVLASIKRNAKSMENHLLPPTHVHFRDRHIKTHLQKIRDPILRIESDLNAVLEDESRRLLKIVPRTAGKMNSEIKVLTAFAESLNAIENSVGDPHSVLSYMLFQSNFALFAARVEVDEIIRENIYEDKDCIVYTAATLRHRDTFDCFHDIVGLKETVPPGGKRELAREVESVTIPSPFSPDSMEIVVPGEAVDGGYRHKQAWLESIRRILPDLIKTNKGRTLVLFASYEDLAYIAERVSEHLTNANYPLLIQKPGAPTVNLCDEFRSIKESVLFGVDTFWYGVDFKGDTLTQVVITRIPFPSPQNPVQVGRKALLSAKQYWQRYYYEKDIKLRQGIGRLVRCDTDKGKVVVLDSRFRKEVSRIKKELYPERRGSQDVKKEDENDRSKNAGAGP